MIIMFMSMIPVRKVLFNRFILLSLARLWRMDENEHIFCFSQFFALTRVDCFSCFRFFSVIPFVSLCFVCSIIEDRNGGLIEPALA